MTLLERSVIPAQAGIQVNKEEKVKKVLVFADYFLPGFRAGGPIQSLRAIIDSLQNEFDFSVITRNHDFNDATPYSVPVDEAVMQNGATVYYQEDKAKSFFSMIERIKKINPDVIYFNSFFSFFYSFLPIFYLRVFMKDKTPLLIAPRGELSKGALSLKTKKKKFFLLIVKCFGLYKAVNWQVTSQEEAKEIHALFPITKKVWVTSNLKKIECNLRDVHEKKIDELNIIFLSRVSRKKNIDFALRVLSQQKKGKITFDIYGPLEDQIYWKECEMIICQLADNITVKYCGELNPSEVVETFSKYHLFFFPTRGENFGHVILEALGAGCPVLTTDTIPWSNLEQAGCGWNISLSHPERFNLALDKMVEMSQSNWNEKKYAARMYFEQHNDYNAQLALTKQMFSNLE